LNIQNQFQLYHKDINDGCVVHGMEISGFGMASFSDYLYHIAFSQFKMSEDLKKHVAFHYLSKQISPKLKIGCKPYRFSTSEIYLAIEFEEKFNDYEGFIYKK